MSELGPIESLGPEEGGGESGSLNQVSESAKERFRAAQAAIKRIREEEKRARKRDDQVAQTIIRFLQDDRYAHLFQLVAQLVARDCPSNFILAILSLVSSDAKSAVDELLNEHNVVADENALVPQLLAEKKDSPLSRELAAWIARLKGVMTIDARSILLKLLVDEHNIDGSVLQLTTFVFMDHLASREQDVPYEEAQPMSIAMLQHVLEPFLHHVDADTLKEARNEA